MSLVASAFADIDGAVALTLGAGTALDIVVSVARGAWRGNARIVVCLLYI